MKSDSLMDAVGLISDEIIMDARSAKTVRTFSIKRVAVLVAAIVLCFALAVTALAAANVDQAYDFLYALSPVIAQRLKPVRISCEDNGIKMEVLSAYINGSSAEIYIAVQDLTGERIDETTDLFDSYRINRPFASEATCALVGYDAEKHMATFLITLNQSDDKAIDGDKVTFSFTELLSGKQRFQGALTQIDLGEVPTAPATQTGIDVRGAGGIRAKDIDGYAKATYLLPSEAGGFDPVSGVTVTALGFIDQKLHVQLRFENILETDNHGFVYLVDSEGNVIESDYSIDFWDAEHKGSYCEEVFSITHEELSEYQLHGDFTTCDTLTVGNWEVTFPLQTAQ